MLSLLSKFWWSDSLFTGNLDFAQFHKTLRFIQITCKPIHIPVCLVVYKKLHVVNLKKNDMTCADYLFVFYSIQFSIPNCFSYTVIFYDFNVQ